MPEMITSLLEEIDILARMFKFFAEQHKKDCQGFPPISNDYGFHLGMETAYGVVVGALEEILARQGE